jgi:hypothetical protein
VADKQTRITSNGQIAQSSLQQLEPYIDVPNGGQARRCQALLTSKTKQCARPASEGFEVCTVHGAGKRKRVERGERKETGRPLKSGLYSRKELRKVGDVLEELQTLHLDLDKSDEELLVMKATIQWLLGQGSRFDEQAETAAGLLEDSVRAINAGIGSADELSATLDKLTEASRLIPGVQSYADRLAEHAFRVIQAVKVRVDTKAKMADAQALESLLVLVQAVRRILHDIVDDQDKLAVLEERLEREVFAPNKLIKPPLDDIG